MLKQIPGQIFLADQREVKYTTQFRRYSTFNLGEPVNFDKESFGSLYVFNEEQIASSQKITFSVEEDSYIVLFPITGAASFTDPEGNTIYVDVEEVLISQIPAGLLYMIANPYEKEPISFLQFWIKAATPLYTVISQITSFRLDSVQNQLTRLPVEETVQELPFSVSLGRFNGRSEALYTLKKQQGLHFFAFVIAGAFEVEGRLLHEKDGLGLWETEEVELEALSNNALILTLELFGCN